MNNKAKLENLHRAENIYFWQWTAHDGRHLKPEWTSSMPFLDKVANNKILTNTLLIGPAAIQAVSIASIFIMGSYTIFFGGFALAMVFWLTYLFVIQPRILPKAYIDWGTMEGKNGFFPIAEAERVANFLNWYKYGMMQTKSFEARQRCHKDYYLAFNSLNDNFSSIWGSQKNASLIEQSQKNAYLYSAAMEKHHELEARSKADPKEAHSGEKEAAVLFEKEEEKVAKLVEEFPEIAFMRKLSERANELNPTDQRSLQVLKRELLESYSVILAERENGNDALAERLREVFKGTVATAAKFAKRMEESIDQAKVDQLIISDTFISDKFNA